MSYQDHKKTYIELIFSFIKQNLDGPEFERRFSGLWEADRDEQRASTDRGSGTLEGPTMETDGKFIDMLDRVFTACDVFDVDPKEEWEIGEEQLRSYVTEMLESYFLVIL